MMRNGQVVQLSGARTMVQAFETDPEKGGVKGAFATVFIIRNGETRVARGIIRGAQGELGIVTIPRQWVPRGGEWAAAPVTACLFHISDVAVLELPAETEEQARAELGDTPPPPRRPPPAEPAQILVPQLVQR